MLQSQAKTPAEFYRQTRLMAGLTTREIAPMIGVAYATIAKWERGAGEPSASQFVRWAQATNQPLDQMIEGLSAVVRPLGFEPRTH